MWMCKKLDAWHLPIVPMDPQNGLLLELTIQVGKSILTTWATTSIQTKQDKEAQRGACWRPYWSQAAAFLWSPSFVVSRSFPSDSANPARRSRLEALFNVLYQYARSWLVRNYIYILRYIYIYIVYIIQVYHVCIYIYISKSYPCYHIMSYIILCTAIPRRETRRLGLPVTSSFNDSETATLPSRSWPPCGLAFAWSKSCKVTSSRRFHTIPIIPVIPMAPQRIGHPLDSLKCTSKSSNGFKNWFNQFNLKFYGFHQISRHHDVCVCTKLKWAAIWDDHHCPARLPFGPHLHNFLLLMHIALWHRHVPRFSSPRYNSCVYPSALSSMLTWTQPTQPYKNRSFQSPFCNGTHLLQGRIRWRSYHFAPPEFSWSRGITRRRVQNHTSLICRRDSRDIRLSILTVSSCVCWTMYLATVMFTASNVYCQAISATTISFRLFWLHRYLLRCRWHRQPHVAGAWDIVGDHGDHGAQPKCVPVSQHKMLHF